MVADDVQEETSNNEDDKFVKKPYFWECTKQNILNVLYNNWDKAITVSNIQKSFMSALLVKKGMVEDKWHSNLKMERIS